VAVLDAFSLTFLLHKKGKIEREEFIFEKKSKYLSTTQTKSVQHNS